MSRLSPIGLNSILSYIKSWVIGKIPTKNSELTNDSGYITTSSVPTNYVTSDTDQVVSGVKTTSNYKYIVGPDMTKGTTPTSNRYITIHRYYDKNMNAVGEYWLRQTATGNTELNLSAKDAFTDGARATTGTDVSSYLSIGVNSSGKSYWEVNGGCRNNLLPLSGNNYTLGSSTLQWNKVYSKEYYINGTIMGDIVTHSSSEYAKSSHTHTKANITDFPAFGTTAGTICQGNDSRLSDARTPTSHTHTKNQITDFPSLATVATSGSYTDLSNKPTIPSNTNQLTNGAGYITSSGSCNYANSAGSAGSVAWNNVSDKPSAFTPYFANGTWYNVGDDVAIGDHNIGGGLGICGLNNTTRIDFCQYGNAANYKSITFDGTTLYMDGNCNYANSAGSANDPNAVHKSGDETIGGTKTYSSDICSTNSQHLWFRHLDGSNNGGMDGCLFLNYSNNAKNVYFNGTDYYINGGYYNGRAENAQYTYWLRTSSHHDHLFHTEWDGSYFWTYVTAGDGGYRPVRVERSNSSGYADNCGYSRLLATYADDGHYLCPDRYDGWNTRLYMTYGDKGVKADSVHVHHADYASRSAGDGSFFISGYQIYVG